MRRLLTAVLASGLALGQPAFAQVPAPQSAPQPSPQPAQSTGRWSLGADALVGTGLAAGPSLGFRVKQWQRSALDAQVEAMWQVEDYGPTVCKRTCPPPSAAVARVAAVGLRWTTELEGPFYGILTASVADMQWAKPTRELQRTARFGMGNGAVFNERGDAVEFRVETFNSPRGREYSVTLGARRTPSPDAQPRERRRLGVIGERTLRTDLRRTRSRVDFDFGTFSGTTGGGRGIAPGISIRQSLHRMWSVEAGAAYVEKGYGRDETLRMNYVEFPVLANLELLPVHSRLQWFVSAGLAPAVLESCTERNAAVYGDQAQRCGRVRAGTNFPQDLRRFDISREFRTGARVKVGAGRVVAMFSGSSGLINVDAAGGRSERTFHRVSSLGLGYERAF